MIKVIEKITFASVFIFVFFVFFDINWGAPYYFHPDERNIASAVTRLDITTSMNPEFFAYGGFPIYTIYFTGLVNNFLTYPFSFDNYTVSFEEAIIIGRVFSGLFTIITIFLIYKITKKISNPNTAIFALLLSTLSVGYLQYSHFGTFEIWLSLFYLLLICSFIILIEKKNYTSIILIGLIFGLCIGIKVSSLILLPIPFLAILIVSFKEEKIYKRVLKLIKLSLLTFYIAFLAFLITNPYVFLSIDEFIKSLNYETAVATGTLPVFYTESFNNTIPIYYHFLKVLPFLINPLITIILIPAFVYFAFLSFRKKNVIAAIIVLTFLLIFISQSILFVKWTRYLVPTIAFIYIFSAIFLYDLKKIIPYKIWASLITIVIIFSVIYPFSYIKTVRLAADSRIAAANFASENIASEARIISEVYDMGIVPFNSNFNNIELFNYYDLEATNLKVAELEEKIKSTEYFILPSQRVYKTRIEKSQLFPNGNKFYTNLAGTPSFKLIYKTDCDIFCKILYQGDPIFSLEETSNIFDRPIVQIYKNESLYKN